MLSSALFIWLLVKQDWLSIWQILRQMPFWILPLAFVLYFSGIVLNTLRWYSLLRSQQVVMPFTDALQIVLCGNFASNFLPSTIGGDSVRAVSTARLSDWSIGLASVVVDRLINLFAMATLLPFSWWSFRPIGLAPIVGYFQQLEFMFAALNVATLWQTKIYKYIKKWLWKTWLALGMWKNRKDVLFAGLLYSWCARLAVFSAVWFLARGLGIVVTLVQVIGVGTITYMLSLLPISVNGFGLREVTMASLYVYLGASLEQASTLVVVTRFILMLETLPGALWISKSLTQSQIENRGLTG